jgi:anti-sigma B factor antagonist
MTNLTFRSVASPTGTVTIAPAGEIDVAHVGSLRHTLVQATNHDQTKRVVVDLRSVALIDSTGLGALIAGLKAAHRVGVSYRVCNANPFIYQRLVTTGLLNLLNYVFADQDPNVASPPATHSTAPETT